MQTAGSRQGKRLSDADEPEAIERVATAWDHIEDIEVVVPPEPSAPRKRRFLSSIQGKIVSRTLAIALIPLLLVGSVTLFSLWRLRNTANDGLAAAESVLNTEVTGSNLTSHAAAVRSEIETLMVERITDIVILSSDPELIATARRGTEMATNLGLDTQTIEQNEAQFSSTRSLRADADTDRRLLDRITIQPEFGELFLTELSGLTIAGSGSTTDLVQSDEEWWQRASNEQIYVSSATYDDSAGIASLDIAARIDDPTTQEQIGVIKGSLDLSQIQAVADRHRITGISQNNLNITVFTTDGLILAETITGHSPGRIMDPSATFQNDRLSAATAALDASESGAYLGDESSAGFDQSRSTLNALGGQGLVHPPSFVVMVDQSTAKASSPLDAFTGLAGDLDRTIRSALALLGIIIAAVVIGAIAAPGFIVRRIVQPLVKLRAEAEAVADDRLPEIMSRLDDTDAFDDIELLEPITLGNDDEIADLADAFTSVQDTAVRLAVEQARSRRNISRLFIDLGRRNQNLIGRQLEFIDTLEQSERDPDSLENLFRLDHLATRMRRNAESLLVLAGEDQPRRWSRPLPISDVIRAAISEVEDYNRVELTSINETRVVGSAASDIAHLLAELIENATAFSPPSSPVMILGRRSAAGYTISIVDHGIGLSVNDLAQLNDNLVSANALDQTGGSSLGLFVVARLAARHGVGVRLLESPAEGVTAKIVLPNSVLDDDAEVDGEPTWRVEPVVQRTTALERRTGLDAPAELESPLRAPVLTSGLVNIDDESSPGIPSESAPGTPALDPATAVSPTTPAFTARADENLLEPTTDDNTAAPSSAAMPATTDRKDRSPKRAAESTPVASPTPPMPAASNGHRNGSTTAERHPDKAKSNGSADGSSSSNGASRPNGKTTPADKSVNGSGKSSENGPSSNGRPSSDNDRSRNGTDRPDGEGELTPSGFRRRTSKAKLAPAAGEATPERSVRDADDVRRKLDRFKAGVESGRAAAGKPDQPRRPSNEPRDGGQS